MRTILALAVLGGCGGKNEPETHPAKTTPTDPTPTTTPVTHATTASGDTGSTTSDSGTTPVTTAQPGDPLLVDVTGWVFALDLANGNWVAPAGVGPLIGSSLAGNQLLVSPTAVGTTDIDLLAALGRNNVQDPCSASATLAGASWTDPSFDAAAPSLSLAFVGTPVELADVEMTGSFLPDGSALGQSEISGTLDTRTLGALFGLGSAPSAVCDLVAAFGVSCVACADGGPYCLWVDVQGVGGPHLPYGALLERTAADIADYSSCN